MEVMETRAEREVKTARGQEGMKEQKERRRDEKRRDGRRDRRANDRKTQHATHT